MIIHLAERDDAKSAVQPLRRGRRDDVGFDLTCIESHIIWPFCTVDIPTGWDVCLPPSVWGSIKARSSTLHHRKLIVLEGVIDPGYRGELSVVVFNPTPWPKQVKAGDRLAQFILVPLLRPQVEYHTDKKHPRWQNTQRGPNGFGSTGR